MDEPPPDPHDWHELIAKNARPWNGYWYWRNKPTMERGAAGDILQGAGVRVEGLRSREAGQDPPDCEAVLDGRWSGIEVTELVHRHTLERSLKAMKDRAAGRNVEQPEAYFVWARNDLIAALQALVDAKDTPAKVKGGPYDAYALVIFTDEFFLDRASVTAFLDGAAFRATMITEAFLGLSYDPRWKASPSFRLNIVPR